MYKRQGIGSRFGGGIKQLEPVDDQKHIIMDYSIHDAIEAGFNKVVFIIRRDIEKEFKEVAPQAKSINEIEEEWQDYYEQIKAQAVENEEFKVVD